MDTIYSLFQNMVRERRARYIPEEPSFPTAESVT